MRIIFAGTPEFAAQALQAIVAAGHDVALVLTQPDRPAGRGLALQPSPVKKLALDKGIEVVQPVTLKDTEAQAKIAAVGAEVMVVAAYGLIPVSYTHLDVDKRQGQVAVDLFGRVEIEQQVGAVAGNSARRQPSGCENGLG